MSARMIQLGLMSLIGSAIAVPVFPTGSFNGAGNSTEGELAGPTGTGRAHGTGRRYHGARPRPSGTGSLTMEAILTPETVATVTAASVDVANNVAAVDATTTSCFTETLYTTTTNFMTVYVTPSAVDAPAEADSTIFASSVAPSSEAAPVVPVASSVATSSAPAVETPVAAVSSVVQNVGKFSYSNTAVVAASSTPIATVAASSSVAAPIQAAPATSTKAAASAAPSASTSTSSAGGKRGIAYNSPSLAKLLIGKSQWAYNWGSTNGGLASGVEFMPMLWGAGAEKTGTWVKDATAGIAAGATALLGFNEPDHTEQANMSPQAAATAYKTHMTDNFAGKAKLISPAVTNGGGSMGLSWLKSFMDLCTDCKIDAVAIHWYDSSSNVEYFKSHIQDAHTQSGLPVYLTEFGTTDGNDQAFLAAVLPWLDSQDYVHKYAYFMASDGKLISGTSLSAAGNTYCA